MKNQDIFRIVGYAFVLIAFTTGNTVLANDDAIYVSINPMSCTPTTETLAQQKFVKTAGRVKFKPNATGKISFICPIGPVHSPDNREDRGSAKADALSITMHYYNKSFDGKISAAVRSADLVTGAVGNVVIVNSSPNTGGKQRFARVSQSGGKLDLTKFTYWVQFTLSRDRVEMRPPDDVSGGQPTELTLAILDLGLKIAKIRD